MQKTTKLLQHLLSILIQCILPIHKITRHTYKRAFIYFGVGGWGEIWGGGEAQKEWGNTCCVLCMGEQGQKIMHKAFLIRAPPLVPPKSLGKSSRPGIG